MKTQPEVKKESAIKVAKCSESMKRTEMNHLFTFYYPYIFYEWKVTVPRYLFKDNKALIRLGVNGLSGLAAQTEMWPKFVMKNIAVSYQLQVKISPEVADEECNRALENYVYRSMRPLKPPIYNLNKKECIYVPYHVLLEKKKKRVLVLEALTGITAELRKMKEVREWVYSKLKQ